MIPPKKNRLFRNLLSAGFPAIQNIVNISSGRKMKKGSFFSMILGIPPIEQRYRLYALTIMLFRFLLNRMITCLPPTICIWNIIAGAVKTNRLIQRRSNFLMLLDIAQNLVVLSAGLASIIPCLYLRGYWRLRNTEMRTDTKEISIQCHSEHLCRGNYSNRPCAGY